MGHHVIVLYNLVDKNYTITMIGGQSSIDVESNLKLFKKLKNYSGTGYLPWTRNLDDLKISLFFSIINLNKKFRKPFKLNNLLE